MINPALLPLSGVTRQELTQRAQCLSEKLKQAGLPLAIIGYNPDLFYFTGSVQAGYALITQEGETVYLARKDPERARVESPLEKVIPFSRFREIKEAVRNLMGGIPRRVMLPLDVVPADLFLRFKELLDRAHIEDGSAMVRECRMIKSPSELENILKGVEIYDKTIRQMPRLIHAGMSEAVAEGMLMLEMRRYGHQGLVRMRGWNQEGIDGCLYAGKAAAIPTFLDAPLGGVGMTPAIALRGGTYEIQRGEPIVFDASPGMGGYVSDQTRTAVIGRLSNKIEEAYGVVREMIQRFEAEARPGDPCSDWFKKMESMAECAGLSENFMGYGKRRVRYVGHGIGLELNEWPVVGERLPWRFEPGMVLAIEPKLVFPEIGAVGLENDYLVTSTGVSRLSITDDEIISLPDQA